MKRFLIVFSILFAALLLIAFIQSNGTPVAVKYKFFFTPEFSLFGWQQPGVSPNQFPLWAVMFGCFLLGFAASTAMGLYGTIKRRRAMSILKKENKKLASEVQTLRNVPLSDEPLKKPIEATAKPAEAPKK